MEVRQAPAGNSPPGGFPRLCRSLGPQHPRQFAIAPARFLSISEVQVLDSVQFQPFGLKIALPDGRDRCDITQYPLRHSPAKPRK